MPGTLLEVDEAPQNEGERLLDPEAADVRAMEGQDGGQGGASAQPTTRCLNVIFAQAIWNTRPRGAIPI